jgi:hypothetical protein
VKVSYAGGRGRPKPGMAPRPDRRMLRAHVRE